MDNVEDDLPDEREIRGVMRGLNDIANGRVRPFTDIQNELRRKHGMTRAEICDWTRHWFDSHKPSNREDFDLPSMLNDFQVALNQRNEDKVN